MAVTPRDEYNIDTSSWMRNLPPQLHNVPLQKLCIPGSHNTFTYTITNHSAFSSDGPKLGLLSRLPGIKNVTRFVVQRWAQTQKLHVDEQLQAGVRYLDIRLAIRPASSEYGGRTMCIAHALFGMDVQEALLQTNEFLKTHPQEIVLIDFQHFYDFQPEDHEKLMAFTEQTFNRKLCYYNSEFISLSFMWSRGLQVIVFYDPGVGKPTGSPPFFWPRSSIANMWPNKSTPRDLLQFLNNRYPFGRPMNCFHVTQGIITPSNKTVLCNIHRTLETAVAPLSNDVIVTWLKTTKDVRNNVNIVIADFVEMEPFQFCKTVIGLNLEVSQPILESVKQIYPSLEEEEQEQQEVVQQAIPIPVVQQAIPMPETPPVSASAVKPNQDLESGQSTEPVYTFNMAETSKNQTDEEKIS